jgi:hypothetical protein
VISKLVVAVRCKNPNLKLVDRSPTLVIGLASRMLEVLFIDGNKLDIEPIMTVDMMFVEAIIMLVS